MGGVVVVDVVVTVAVVLIASVDPVLSVSIVDVAVEAETADLMKVENGSSAV
jgi:hypothetical protein